MKRRSASEARAKTSWVRGLISASLLARSTVRSAQRSPDSGELFVAWHKKRGNARPSSCPFLPPHAAEGANAEVGGQMQRSSGTIHPRLFGNRDAGPFAASGISGAMMRRRIEWSSRLYL